MFSLPNILHFQVDQEKWKKEETGSEVKKTNSYNDSHSQHCRLFCPLKNVLSQKPIQ